MRLTRFATPFLTMLFFAAAAALQIWPSTPSQADQLPPELQAARAALERYQDPMTAIREGYLSTMACVDFKTGGMLNGMPYPAGGMGVHMLNMSQVGKLDPAHPQVLIYEPLGDKLQLAAAEWFVPYAKGMAPPEMFGQRFYGPMMGHYPVMPKELVHYDLHVWLWKQNHSGVFTPTNPDVKCPESPYTYHLATPDMPMQ